MSVGPTPPAVPDATYGRFSRTGRADIRDFGARPDRRDNEVAIQAAADWLVLPTSLATGDSNPDTRAGTVVIPAGTWVTSGPIHLDYAWIEVRGEGEASRIYASHKGAAFLIGLKRRPPWSRTARVRYQAAQHAAFVPGSATVTAADGDWMTSIRPSLGGPIRLFIRPDGDPTWYAIASVSSDTALTLDQPYAGPARADGPALVGADAASRMPVDFAADHHPDLLGKLDASVTGGIAGARRGITGRSPSGGHPWADHAVAFLHAPPCHADRRGWGAVRRLTVDACLEPAPGRPFGRQCLMGMGNPYASGSAGPAPWRLDHLGGPLAFLYMPADATGVSYRPVAGWSIGPDLGREIRLVRVAVQVDLDAGTCRAWMGFAGGPPVEVPTAPIGAPAPGGRFRDHEPGATFNLFSAGSSHVNFGDGITPPRRGTQRLYGLRLTAGLRYDGAGVGSPARPHASGPADATLDDAFRYTAAPDRDRLIGCLDLDRAGTANVGFAGRVVGLESRSGRGHPGYFFPAYSDSDDVSEVVPYRLGTESNAIRDLAIQPDPDGAGAILVGQCYHPTIERASIRGQGGWIGIGQTGGTQSSVYDVRVRDCSLSGQGAWLHVGFGIWYVERLARRVVYRNAITVQAGNLYLTDLIGGTLTGVGADGAPTGLTTRALVWAPSGGLLDLRRVHHDQEWPNGAPCVGLIVMGTSDGGWSTSPATLTVEDVVAAVIGAAPVFRLFSAAATTGRILARNAPSRADRPVLLVDVDGPRWSGSVRDVPAGLVATAIRAAGPCRVAVELAHDAEMPVPPTADRPEPPATCPT